MAIERIASAAETAEASRSIVEEDIRTILEAHFRHFLWSNYSLSAEIKRAVRKRWPRLVAYAQNLPRYCGRERAEIFSQLSNAGASRFDVERVQSELATIECALAPAAFAEFTAEGAAAAHQQVNQTLVNQNV